MFDKDKILLETGTNKFQYAEFSIGPNTYGINIAKVREFIRVPSFKKLPKSHSSVEGVFKLRSDVIMLVNLAKFLGIDNSNVKGRKLVIVTEFNGVFNGFLVDKINDIFTASWEEISSVSKSSEQTLVTGIISKEDKIVFILDFEKIISEVMEEEEPYKKQTLMSTSPESVEKRVKRTEKKIMVAEDSSFARDMIKDYLTKAGYKNIEYFENGKAALDRLLDYTKKPGKLNNYVDLLLTDIEMPLMDGQHLVKRIRGDKNLRSLPIVIFSSISNDVIRRRSMAIGANGQISKPELPKLVDLLDKILLKEEINDEDRSNLFD
jgi:two-component system, chemotaxis family, chemotaxis protein CheV